MSLEDLRKQIDEEETAAVEAVDEVEAVEEDEPVDDQEANESEPESADESETAETDDDFDFDIDGEEPKKPKHTPEEAMLYKLTKKSKQLKGAKSEIEQLREELEAVKSGMVAPQPVQAKPVPQQASSRIPDLYEDFNGDRDAYGAAVRKLIQEENQRGQQDAQQAAQQAAQTQKQAKTEHDRALRLAGRSATFIKDNKINEDKATEAIRTGVEALDTLTGIQGGGLYLLDSVGEDSEKLALYFGRDPSRLNQVKEWLEEDETGLKAIAQMTRLVTTKLKPKTSKSKKSLEPDEPLKGSTSTKSAGDLQRRYDAADDFTEMLKIRREAEKRGVKLS